MLLSFNLYSQQSDIRKELDLMNNEINLNAYRYIVIEALGAEAQKWGTKGFSDFIEETLERKRRGKKMYNVVSIYEGKPDILVNNPELGLYVYGTNGDMISSGITVDSNLNFGSFFGTNDNSTVYFEFYDHNKNLLKVSKANTSNFHSSVIKALKFMTDFKYKFDPNLVGVNKPINNKIDTSSSENKKEYSVEDAIKRLREVKSLLEEGLITQEEFDKISSKLKAIILD
tara:strand:- start:92 stop:778 length:687 start_codon:yes stop_codon:yes gene_type:complete